MTEFPMNARLFHDGFQLDRFHAKDVYEFGEELFAMLRFVGEPSNDDLQYADCKTQLLGSFDVRLIMLFGGLTNIRDLVPLKLWEELSMGICKLFYLRQVGDTDAYAKVIHELDNALGASVRKGSTANDQ